MPKNYLPLVFIFHVTAVLGYGQITYDGCRDINGVPVSSMPANIGDIAIAGLDFNGSPVIRYNPWIVSSIRPQTRLFFYAHECGHHALGHVLSGYYPQQEEAADCWSLKTLISRNMVDEMGIGIIFADLINFGRADATHLPGPQRVAKLQACLNE